MNVIAKFKVTLNEPYGEGRTVFLSPVISGSPENEEFYKWTPAGQITLSTINEEAAKQFTVGRELYVTFSDMK